MSETEFPQGFQFGAASAAHAVEGATRADGKGESIWDRFAQTPGRLPGEVPGDLAGDAYDRFDEVIGILRELGLASYRFSLAWPRIQPIGRGRANAKGIDYYRRVVDGLLEAGIRPLPTLYHWDLPQALEDAGGWPNRDTAGRFADYAEIVAEALADRVEDWVMLESPSVFLHEGYGSGRHAPGRSEPEALLRATHHANLALGEATRAMRGMRGGLRIGTSLRMSPCEPAADTDEDLEAARRFDGWTNLWFLEPALAGRYPDAFPEGVPERALGVQARDMDARVRADLDFLVLAIDGRTFVRWDPDEPLGLGASAATRETGNDRTESGLEVWPRALSESVLRMAEAYPELPLEVTVGCSYGDAPDESGIAQDARRIDFHARYLEALLEALAAGADVRGYSVWSLLDGYEWADATTSRTGLVYVDFDTGERFWKSSARWYAELAHRNALPG